MTGATKLRGFTRLRMRRYLLGRRDQAQVRLDATPGDNKLALARALGRREAFEDIIAAIDEGHVERGYVAGVLAGRSEEDTQAPSKETR